MTALVTLTEFKAVLGVGSLYPDADLQQVLDAAEDITLSYLSSNAVNFVAYTISDNVLTAFTDQIHTFQIGQTITVVETVTGINGTHTLTAVTPYSMQWAYTAADSLKITFNPPGRINGPATVDYSLLPAVCEASLTIAVDLWNNRVAPGGQQQGVDFTPGPYRAGRSLMQRVIGLLAPYMNVGGIVG